MGRARRTVRHARLAAHARWHQKKLEVSALRMAYAILVEGARPEQIREVFKRCGIIVPTRQELYKEMRTVCNTVINLALQNMDDELEKMPEGSVLSFDGSWDHRRRGKQCLFTVICHQNGKIVECLTISKAVPETSENYCGDSNRMEAKGLSLAIDRLRQCPNIVGYVHDNDASARKMIRESGWEIIEYLDPGHTMKAFERRVTSFNRKNCQVLRGIEGALKSWMAALLKSSDPVEEKVKQWNNAVNHLSGDHSNCHHGDCKTTKWDLAEDEGAVDSLKKFLASTQFILEKCNPTFSTQKNESFHRMKLKFATKDVHWGFTWNARMMCAVLENNMKGWKDVLFHELGLDRVPEDVEIHMKNARFPGLRNIPVLPRLATPEQGEPQYPPRRPMQIRRNLPVYKGNPYTDK